MPDVTLYNVETQAAEALILPGGDFWDSFADERLQRLVTTMRGKGALVAGICGATGYLARIGLLDDVAHTSNSLAFLKSFAPNYRGEKQYRNKPAVADHGIVTASGLGAVDFTHRVLVALAVYSVDVAEIWLRAVKSGIDPDAT